MTLSVKDKARLYREFSKLFAASFPMDKSVTMLAEQHSSGPRHVFLQGLQAGLASKLSFAEALKTQNSALATDLELSLIDSGERSGRLAQACEHLAHYFDIHQQTKISVAPINQPSLNTRAIISAARQRIFIN
jgi:type II secretory pathway component PulF